MPSGERDIELRDRATTPAEKKVSVQPLALGGELDLFEEGAEEFLAVPVGGGGGRPHTGDVGSEGSKRVALVWGHDLWAIVFAADEFGFGVGQLAQAYFPFGFQAARDETVFRFDATIAALGALRFITKAFDFQTSLSEGVVMLSVEGLLGGERSVDAGRGDSGEESFRDSRVDLNAADA